ncbi:hypothetical protein Emag_003252 [Eimeria magna]
MPPDVSARVLPRASCDLEEGELSPSPAAANLTTPAPPTENISISAAEAEAAALDFFEGVAAHRAEQCSKEWDSHSLTASPCALPSSDGVRTPETPAQADAARDGSEPQGPPSSLPEPAGVCSGPSTSRTPKGLPYGHGACPADSGSNPPCLPSASANENQGGGRPEGPCSLQEIQHVTQDQGPLSGVRPLLSPCGSIVGLLQQQPHQQQQQQPHDEATKSRGLLPLDLQKAHQQRMQTLDIQRGTEALDDPLHIGPNEDLMKHVQRLSTKIRAQEDEKRVMAEESFQLEQILKRQYHADIREKNEENKQLLQTNETLKQQLEKLNGECQGLRGALAVLDEVLDGFFNRQLRPPSTQEASEEKGGTAEPREAQAPSTCKLQDLYDALMDAFRAEASTLDKEAEEELRQRIEAACGLCRAATAGVVAAGVLSPSAWQGAHLMERLPSSSHSRAPRLSPLEATGAFEEKALKGSTSGLLRPLGSPPSSSEAQLETLKAQIERLRDNLGAFTEGVLHAHKRHVRSYKQLKTSKSGPQAPNKLELLKATARASSAGAPTSSMSEEKAPVVAAARGPPQGAPPALAAGPSVGAPLVGKEKARRPLWSNATMGGVTAKATKGPSSLQLQQPLLADPLRGTVLLPASHNRQQQQQQQRLRCKPCPGGTPLDVCCEGSCLGGPQQQQGAPSRTGIVLPPLKQRQRQSSRGPCTRRRAPSGGPSAHGGAAGRNLSNSASAVALLPALKPAASAAATSSKGLMGSASAVDLSVVGRHVGSSLTASNCFAPLYEGPPAPPLSVYGYTSGTRALHPSASPSAAARSQWGATARSNSSSSSSGRVFSRTRRSCSPIKERAQTGACVGPLKGGAPREASVGGAPSHRRRMTDVLSLESKVGPVGTEGKEKATRAPPPLYAKDAWEPPQFQGFGGPQGFYPLHWGGGSPPGYYPSLMGPHHSAARMPKELSPSASSTGGKSGRGPPVNGEEGGLMYKNRMWAPTNTRLVAAAGNQDAMAAAAAAAGLVPSSSGMYMYSQPPRAGGLPPSLMDLSPHYLMQQQHYRQPSPFGHSPTSPASAQAAGSFKARTPTSYNACNNNTLQYRLISPTSGRTPSLSSFSVSQGGSLGGPALGASAGAAQCGGCGLLSPMCYSNPPLRSPGSSSRSSSNIHSIQRPRRKGDEAGEWMHARP